MLTYMVHMVCFLYWPSRWVRHRLSSTIIYEVPIVDPACPACFAHAVSYSTYDMIVSTTFTHALSTLCLVLEAIAIHNSNETGSFLSSIPCELFLFFVFFALTNVVRWLRPPVPTPPAASRDACISTPYLISICIYISVRVCCFEIGRR